MFHSWFSTKGQWFYQKSCRQQWDIAWGREKYGGKPEAAVRGCSSK